MFKEIEELIYQLLRVVGEFEKPKLLFLAIVAAIGLVLTAIISRQIGKLRDLAKSVTTAAASVEISADKASNSAALSLKAAEGAESSASKVGQVTKDLERTVVSIDQATNMLQAARGKIDDAVVQLGDNPAIQAALRSAKNDNNGSTVDFWPEVSDLWSHATDLLEEHVQSISDGRRLRKYSKEPRHTYFRVIQMLAQDGPEHGGLTQEQASAANTMNAQFLTHRTRKRPVSRIEREEFLSLARKLGVASATATVEPRADEASLYRLGRNSA